MIYEILKAFSTDALALQVNRYLSEGWIPLGGVAVEGDGGRGQPRFMQAMLLPRSGAAQEERP